jgi:ATP-dependent RNA helicase DeaD
MSTILVPPGARRAVESMLRRTGARVSFTPAPDADVIRVHDRDRLVREIEKLVVSPAEDDVTLARLLLKERDPLELAAALVKLKREALPAPEELPLSIALAKKPPPRAEAPRTAFAKPQSANDDFEPPAHGREKAGGVWFRINIGRTRNADPRWLLPIICRKGEVDRRHVGRIEILANETRFEVARAAATHFRKAAAKPDKKDPNLKITQIESR